MPKKWYFERQGEIHSSHPLQYYAVIIGGIERHDFPRSKICKARDFFCHTWANTSSVPSFHRANDHSNGAFIIQTWHRKIPRILIDEKYLGTTTVSIKLFLSQPRFFPLGPWIWRLTGAWTLQHFGQKVCVEFAKTFFCQEIKET